MGREPDSWSKGRGFESLQKRWAIFVPFSFFLLQSQLSSLIFISVSAPPRVTYYSRTGGGREKKNDPGRSAKSVGDEVMQVNRKLWLGAAVTLCYWRFHKMYTPFSPVKQTKKASLYSIGVTFSQKDYSTVHTVTEQTWCSQWSIKVTRGVLIIHEGFS